MDELLISQHFPHFGMLSLSEDSGDLLPTFLFSLFIIIVFNKNQGSTTIGFGGIKK